MSPSARKNMSRVWLRIAGTSEATKYSPSPRPMTTGGPERAATILFGSVARDHAQREDAGQLPSRRRARRLPGSRRKYFSTRCAMTSVSVSVTKVWPSFCQLLLQRQIVFDDAVVHHDDVAVCNRDADGRSPRSGGRAWPSACGRCHKRRPPDSAA